MAKTADAIFRYGLDKLFFLPHNPDKTRAVPTRMLGSSAVMDFSSAASPGAIPFSVRKDGGAAISGTIDLDDVGITISAVTPAQWQTAMAAGLTAAGATGWTASVDETTGRCKLAAPSGSKVAECYGLGFTLANFGGGKGVKFFVSDEAESLTPAANNKEDATQTVTNSRGVDTTVVVSGYPKGYNLTLVDLPEDYNTMSLVSGGVIDSTGKYLDPTPTQAKAKLSFEVWVLRRNYNQGENQENSMTGYEVIKYYNCTGSVIGGAMNAGFDKSTYNILALNYADESSVVHGAAERYDLDISTGVAEIAILEAV